MKRWSICLAALVAAFAGGAAAQSPDYRVPVIVVTGHGEAKAAPDYATLSFTVRGEGKTSVEALQSLAEKRDAVEGGVKNLAGASAMAVENGELKMEEAHDPACKSEDDSEPRLSAGACSVTGYVVTVDDSVRISPATVAGDGASLASQLGAVEVSLSDTGVTDKSALRLAAIRAGVEDAQAQAQRIALVTGVHLGRIVRVDFGQPPQQTVQEMVVTAAKLQARSNVAVPAVAMKYSPAPITRDEDITVTYAIEP